MSGLNRLGNFILNSIGFNEWGSREPIPENIEDEIVEGEQVFSDFGIPGTKIHKLKVDQLIAGSILTDEYIQSTGFVDGVSGWQIQGNGDATFANITLTGGIFKYVKTSPTDTAKGYWFGPDSGEPKFVIGDPDKQMDWNVTESGQFTLKKSAISTVGNALNVVDLSDDANASALVQFTGDNASKELLRIEMDATMTTAKSGIAIDKEGGTATNLLEVDNADGDVDNVAYFRNQYTQGQVGFFHQDHASNQEPTIVVRADAPFNTNFYRLMNLDGNATANLDFYIANNDDPNGTLSGGIGDVCFSTDGKIYTCQGTTTWTDVGAGDDSYVYGDGSDGDLTITSGTTTIDTAGKYIYQYNNVSITGTGTLAGGSNLQDYPTYILVRGDLTITSSATPAVDWDYLGSSGGAGGNPATTFGTGSNGGAGQSGAAEWNGGIYPGGGAGRYDNAGGSFSGGASYSGCGGGGGGAWATAGSVGSYSADVNDAGAGGVTSIFDGNTAPMRHIVAPYMGGGGGGGGAGTNNYPNGGTYGATGGAGGYGGGCVIFIVKGNINITGTFHARGGAGNNSIVTASSPYIYSGAGGGGGGGFVGIYYSGSVTASSGTYTVTGGAGGAGSGLAGGAGGTGRSEVRYVPYLSIKI
jgi:hypothetical protein